MSVRRSVRFSPEVERVTYNDDDDSYDVTTEPLKEESDKSSVITSISKKVLSAKDKKFIRGQIESLAGRQIELVDFIQSIENDAEISECFREMNELGMRIKALKEQL